MTLRWLLFGDKRNPFPPKPDRESGFAKPLAWLLGRQALAGAKWMLLYAAFRNRLDSRAWMTGSLETVRADPDAREFWFDYTADTGDGQKAMYSVAYLCLSDLWADREPVSGEAAAPSLTMDRRDGSFTLPRGAFLFLGGDTAYPVADYATLASRVQLPFYWAATDLARGGRPVENRALFGIPGNHDYYDILDGFERQFREPVCPEMGTPPGPPPRDCTAQLTIPGFSRVQQASYFAIRLPFDWWLWGVDAEEDPDRRQLAFFRDLNGGTPPAKLIVATPEPTTVLGSRARAGDKVPRAFEALGLEAPFLHDGALDASKCRMDLSGDTHRYARYWGPAYAHAGGTTPRANYASVVAGIGGAAMHPWSTDATEVREQVLYPTLAASRVEFARALINPFKMWTAGYLWLIGLSASVLFYVGGTLTSSGKAFVDRILLRPLDVVSEAVLDLQRDWTIVRTVAAIDAADVTPFVYSLIMFGSLLCVIAAVAYAIRHAARLDDEAAERPITGWDYWSVWVAYGLAVAIVVASASLFGRYPARRVFSDVVFAFNLVVLTLGMAAFGALVGAEFARWPTKILFAIFGLYFGVVQLLAPFAVVRVGSVWHVFAIFAIGLVLIPVGGVMTARAAPRWLFAAVWIAYGLLAMSIPLAAPRQATLPQGWLVPVFIVLAAGGGAAWVCSWFGWYLLVGLAFACHNDEAAGAARVDKFKGLVRIRVRERDLTAFVIGVDEPQIDGRRLRPKLVDVFTLRAGGGGAR
jgi:hypothetical protein